MVTSTYGTNEFHFPDGIKVYFQKHPKNGNNFQWLEDVLVTSWFDLKKSILVFIIRETCGNYIQHYQLNKLIELTKEL